MQGIEGIGLETRMSDPASRSSGTLSLPFESAYRVYAAVDPMSDRLIAPLKLSVEGRCELPAEGSPAFHEKNILSGLSRYRNRRCQSTHSSADYGYIKQVAVWIAVNGWSRY